MRYLYFTDGGAYITSTAQYIPEADRPQKDAYTPAYIFTQSANKWEAAEVYVKPTGVILTGIPGVLSNAQARIRGQVMWYVD